MKNVSDYVSSVCVCVCEVKEAVVFKLYLAKLQVFIKCVLGFPGKLDMLSQGQNSLPLGPVVNRLKGLKGRRDP